MTLPKEVHPTLYFSCSSGLWHHQHSLLASLPYTFLPLCFLDNAVLHSSHNCWFLVLIYFRKKEALAMLGRNISNNKAKATYIGNTELYSVVYKLTRKKYSEKAVVITIMLVKILSKGGCLNCVCPWHSLHLVPGQKKSTMLNGKRLGNLRIQRFETESGYWCID